MKVYILSTLFLLITKISFCQDLSVEASFKKLKGVSYSIAEKNTNGKIYNAILSNNTILNVKYNAVQSGEYNATYLFIKPCPDAFFENKKNTTYLLNNIDKICSVLNIKQEHIELIKKKISASSIQINKDGTFNLDLDFLGTYDECTFTFKNAGEIIYIDFYFRRIL